jgi:hypothetical protein
MTNAQKQVLRSLQLSGPSTDADLVSRKGSLPCYAQSSEGISRRRRELVDQGLVRHVGDRISANGFPHSIWAAGPFEVQS